MSDWKIDKECIFLLNHWSPYANLSAGQLSPKPSRPMPTQPDIQNSAQDNSAQFLVLLLDNSSHILEGLKYVCFIITWKIRPFTFA